MDGNKVKEDFKKELRALLLKYDARLTADDHWQGYAECGKDVRMTVEFSNWEVSDLDLGQYFDNH